MGQPYDDLPTHLKGTHDKLRDILHDEVKPEDWIKVLSALRQEIEIDAIAKVPYEGPYPLPLCNCDRPT